jgi:hypothetical protein
MRSVYTSCRECLVYLGPTTESSAIAIELWQRVAKVFDALPSHRTSDAFLLRGEVLAKTDTLRDGLEWDALGRLLNRPWFTRMWVSLSSRITIICHVSHPDTRYASQILQEVVLASRVQLLYGQDCIHWSTFAQLSTWNERAALPVTLAYKEAMQHSVNLVTAVRFPKQRLLENGPRLA